MDVHTGLSIDGFQATDQPISGNTMKNMILSLRRETVQKHAVKIQHLETKMADLYS